MSASAELIRRSNDLKNRARAFRAATASGMLNPQQVINLGMLLVDTAELIGQILKPTNDIPIRGVKLGDNAKVSDSVTLGSGAKVGQN